MKQVTNRLCSRNGSSLALALVVFMITVIMSATVISRAAASDNEKRREWQNEQALLTARSAAVLLQNSVCAGQSVQTDITVSASGETSRRIEETDPRKNPFLSAFRDMMIPANTAVPGAASKTLKFSLYDAPDELDDVYVILSMTPSYDVTAFFTTQRPENPVLIKMEFNCSQTNPVPLYSAPDENGIVMEEGYQYSCSWNLANVEVRA